jgi:hypothetical protein
MKHFCIAEGEKRVGKEQELKNTVTYIKGKMPSIKFQIINNITV